MKQVQDAYVVAATRTPIGRSHRGFYRNTRPDEMLATVLGVEFNPNSSWDEKREIWRIADVIFQTKEITQVAVGNKDGLWTTVIAAAVLLP